MEPLYINDTRLDRRLSKLIKWERAVHRKESLLSMGKLRSDPDYLKKERERNRIRMNRDRDLNRTKKGRLMLQLRAETRSLSNLINTLARLIEDRA